tara:strand:- start:99 stop:770 length:672 start_codon:yes stop_codon:yes gene_type:complete
MESTQIITKETKMKNTNYKYNDGGRADAGYKGKAGDCVVRAIAIATELPYQEVYDGLKEENQKYANSRRTRGAKKIKAKGTTPRNGNYRDVYQPYLESKGWTWKPTMKIGQGCKVHLKADELPSGKIICRLSRHIVAVIDGVVNDTHDSTRDGKRCVYGYFHKPTTNKKLYKVKVDINDTQFWEVEAESEQEAMDNYMEGSHYHTNSHGEDVEVMEEIKERKS